MASFTNVVMRMHCALIGLDYALTIFTTFLLLVILVIKSKALRRWHFRDRCTRWFLVPLHLNSVISSNKSRTTSSFLIKNDFKKH
jgi:hypothetical protein